MLFADQGAEVVILRSGGGGGKKDGRLTDGDDVAEKRAGDMLDRNKIRPRNRTTGQKQSWISIDDRTLEQVDRRCSFRCSKHP